MKYIEAIRNLENRRSVRRSSWPTDAELAKELLKGEYFLRTYIGYIGYTFTIEDIYADDWEIA